MFAGYGEPHKRVELKARINDVLLTERVVWIVPRIRRELTRIKDVKHHFRAT